MYSLWSVIFSVLALYGSLSPTGSVSVHHPQIPAELAIDEMRISSRAALARSLPHSLSGVHTSDWLMLLAALALGATGLSMVLFSERRPPARANGNAGIRCDEDDAPLFGSTLPTRIFYLDKDRRYRAVNEAFTDWFGLPKHAIVGLHVKELVGDTAWTIIRPWLDRAYAGELVDYETEIPYRHGGTKWIHAVYTPQRNQDGLVIGVAVLVSDITKQKRAEQDLRVSEERYQYIFDTLGVAIFEEDWTGIREMLKQVRSTGVTDLRAFLDSHPDMVHEALRHVLITDVNQYTLHLFKADSRSALLGALDRIFVPETIEVFKEELIAAWEGRDMYRGHAPLRTLQGDELTVLFTLVVPKRERDWQRVMITLTDVTALRQAEASLRESEQQLRTAELRRSQEQLRALAAELTVTEQRERQRFASQLHDHLQQLLVLGKLKLTQAKRAVGAVPSGVSLLEQVDEAVNTALDYSRSLIAELSPPVLRQHGLVAGIKWLPEWMERMNLTVTVEAHEEYVSLPEAQAVLVFQSVRELLINAAKYAGTSRATVRLDVVEGQLCIEIRDEGVGFTYAPVSGSRQAPDTTRSSKFGLFSIQERMTALGGSFEIRSALGQGTQATLRLPLVLVPAKEQAEATEASPPPPLETTSSEVCAQQIRLLVVDDHAMVREGLRDLLEHYTDVHVVGEARNGREAIAVSEQLGPDVVIMDINMPVMNGIEATSQIKQRHPATMVIGISVSADPQSMTAMMRAGAAMLITKEAAVNDLYAAVKRVWKPVCETRDLAQHRY